LNQLAQQPSLADLARDYVAAGLCALPAIGRYKRPAVAWKVYQRRLPNADELCDLFAKSSDAICIVTGKVSGNLELLDFDQGGELFDRWWSAIPPNLRERLVIESSQSGGRHVIFRCDQPVDGNLKLAKGLRQGKLVTLIETRGEGGLFLCHPTAGYELLQGRLTDIAILTREEREALLMAAWKLDEPEIERQHFVPVDENRPGDEFNERGDIVELLQRHGWNPGETHEDGNQHWTRAGKDSGTSATLKDRVFYVFSSNAEPLQAGKAYSPFSLYSAIEHNGDFEAAARSLGQLGFGSTPQVKIATAVEIHRPPNPAMVSDPGRLPEGLFQVPGFIQSVIDFTLANAPYPNVGLAFCGAVALLSFLAGRKVATAGDLRTNLYLLALASSGTGKEFPRKVNSQILHQIGMSASLGDKFASGEGIQDALIRTGCMLFQNDEMDGVLRQINSDQDNRRESIPNILLTLYTSASDVYPTRVKAGQKEAIQVDQPHLTLFGTATPQYFYESLSRRMLTNGFFARLSIVDVGRRGEGQKPGSARRIPKAILEVAKWWAEYEPGKGNFLDFHPAPLVVPVDTDAEQAIEELRRMTEIEYSKAENENDEVARTAWSRTCEHATKLALIYACSECHQSPHISIDAVRWATEFAMHQTRRQLFLAGVHVADNPFHADCLKLMKVLRETSDGQMQRQHLLRAMRCKAADFDQLVGTLIQQGDIEVIAMASATKPATGYRLL
jgi:hypothetical protein